MKREKFQKFGMYALMFSALSLTACSKDDDDNHDDEPPHEHGQEMITDVTLTFVNTNDPTDVVVARAQDPDGEGVADIEVLDAIELTMDATYVMTVEVENTLETPAEDISHEIEHEADEHQFFYAFTNNAFSNPTGDGNIDNASDPVNYIDFDENGNPLGLETEWVAGATVLEDGEFRIRLQHQPDEKTSTSGANVGDTDIDLTFELHIH